MVIWDNQWIITKLLYGPNVPLSELKPPIYDLAYSGVRRLCRYHAA